MQEDIENKTVALAINTTKLTVRELRAAILKFLAAQKNKSKSRDSPEISHGKQSVKTLAKQNQGMTSIEITDKNIKSFERVAKKYGVDFAVVKDKTAEPIKYTVFFKAKDADAISQVLQEYAQKQLKRKQQNRPSVLKTLKKFKDFVAGMPKKHKEKRKEPER